MTISVQSESCKSGPDTVRVKEAINMTQQAKRQRLLASEQEPIRAEFSLRLADSMDREATALLAPAKPLKNGAGGEIVPPMSANMPGLEHALQRPDMVDLEASIQRTGLAERAGVFELALSTAESAKARGAVQQMLSHQLAAAHKHAMRLLADSERERDSVEKCRQASTAAKLMDAFSRGAATLQRLQNGGNQIVTVQHVQVNGQAIIGMGAHGK